MILQWGLERELEGISLSGSSEEREEMHGSCRVIAGRRQKIERKNRSPTPGKGRLCAEGRNKDQDEGKRDDIVASGCDEKGNKHSAIHFPKRTVGGGEL